MNKLLSILLLLIVSSISKAQYGIGHTTITYTDSSRNNRTIATEIYYPADVTGDNVPVASGTELFPVLVFGHGFVMTYDAYENIWTEVVPNGYIIAFPKSEGGLAPSHQNFGDDLAYVTQAIYTDGQNSANPLFNRVDTMNCIMGHSMGGGAAFLALQSHPQIKSILTFAAAETNPSAVTASATITQTALVFAGANDCVAPPAANQLLMYNGLTGLCKSYISITGGSHCQMADNNFLCSFGEATCSPQSAISRSVQHDVINRYMVPWLNSTLKFDCASGSSFDSTIVSDTTITYLKNCLLCNTTNVTSKVGNPSIKISPNPAQHSISIKIAGDALSSICTITDVLGNVVSQTQLHSSVETIPVQQLKRGLYFLNIRSASVNATIKFVKE